MADRDLKRTVTSDPDPSLQRDLSGSVDASEIAVRAYELWQDRGRPIGSDQEDWFKAESELKSPRVNPRKAA